MIFITTLLLVLVYDKSKLNFTSVEIKYQTLFLFRQTINSVCIKNEPDLGNMKLFCSKNINKTNFKLKLLIKEKNNKAQVNVHSS